MKNKSYRELIIYTTFGYRPSCFPLNLSHEPLFLCWDHSVAGMKTVELTPPPPFSRTNFHAFSSSLVPFLIFFISATTVDSRQLKPSGEIEIKREWNYVRISKTKAPPPTSPPTLCKSSNQISESIVDTN